MATSSAIFCDVKSEAIPHRQVKSKSSYLPHLDGLRALAILGILFEHFGMTLPTLLRCGPLSVRFFFVLSGYFITLSLWKLQAEVGKSNGGSFLPLCRFYLRRLVRIGPPFYLALLVGALFGVEEVRTNLFWLATFQANNYIAWIGYWPNSISHFWSLAVQEQFYLLWPVIVLTLPRRWFLPVMAAFIVFGLIFRFWCIATEASTLTRWVTLFGCVDSFAVGALIAYMKQARLLERMRFLSPTALFAMPLGAFGCFFLGRALMTLPENNLFLALTETVDAVFLAWALVAALVGGTGRYIRLLSWSPLVYLGRISYGIYVYHVFVIVLISPLLVRHGVTVAHFALLRTGIFFVLTVAVASLSWHYVEQPFLAWRNSASRRKADRPQEEVVSPVPAWTLLPGVSTFRRISSTLAALI
jgi:peptidoglycan/LPS O-acetylase OafA/YrhL